MVPHFNSNTPTAGFLETEANRANEMKPWLRYLSDDECDRIHKAALQILIQIGMRLPGEKAQLLLAGAGAKVEANNVVRIPGNLVEKAIETVPKRQDVVLFGRKPEHDLDFHSHRPALTCMTMATSVIDPVTGRRRSATIEDLQILTRLADGLPNIRVNGGLVTPQEVPMAVNDWYTWATCLKNTANCVPNICLSFPMRKPLHSGFGPLLRVVILWMNC